MIRGVRETGDASDGRSFFFPQEVLAVVVPWFRSQRRDRSVEGLRSLDVGGRKVVPDEPSLTDRHGRVPSRLESGTSCRAAAAGTNKNDLRHPAVAVLDGGPE